MTHADGNSPSGGAARSLTRADGASIAYYATPAQPGVSAPGVMFLGGFRSDMSGSKAIHLEQACAARGQGYLRFDYRGHGESDCDFRDGCIGDWFDDALLAFDELTEGPQILVGSSMGGWIAGLIARERPDRVGGLVGIAAAPDFTEDLMRPKLTPAQTDALNLVGSFDMPSAYSDEPTPITAKLMDDGANHLLMRGAIPYAGPARLLHGLRDPDVPWETALRFAERLAGEDVVVTLIKDGEHRLSRPQDLALIAAAVAELSGFA
ncbi:MAG: alpha/beta hydrolase [Pseudomonadota bacterium]